MTVVRKEEKPLADDDQVADSAVVVASANVADHPDDAGIDVRDRKFGADGEVHAGCGSDRRPEGGTVIRRLILGRERREPGRVAGQRRCARQEDHEGAKRRETDRDHGMTP